MRTRARTEVARLHGQITSIGTNADGSTITAHRRLDRGGVDAARKGPNAPGPRPRAAGHARRGIPLGRFISVYRQGSGDNAYSGPAVITLHDQLTKQSSDAQIDPVWTEQVIPSETETVFFNQGGRWQRRSLPDLVKQGEGKIAEGTITTSTPCPPAAGSSRSTMPAARSCCGAPTSRERLPMILS
jgi:hypothetical protein